MRIMPSASPLPATRRTASGPSSPVSSSTSYPWVRAVVATAMAISVITGTWMSVRRGIISATMLDLLPARARAPAFGWYPSSRMLRSTRCRVVAERDRLPLRT